MVSPQFGSLDLSAVQKTLAASSLTQLYRDSFFIKASVTEYENIPSEVGNAVSIRRPKDFGQAQEFDPRGGVDAILHEPDYVIVPFTLEKLYTLGIPLYSHDANLDAYVNDYTISISGAIRKSVDDYLYDTGFRNYNISSTGLVNYGAHPPLAIVVNEDSSGNILSFDGNLLISANRILDSFDVPSDNRYAAISPYAKASFLGDAILVEGFAAANAGGTTILGQGLPMGSLIQRYGFFCGGSNAIRHQLSVGNVGNSSATNNIASISDDTTVFFQADKVGDVPLGAVQLTLQSIPLPPEVSVGAIARLGPSGSASTAYGVILRVDSVTGDVWLVPYSPAGNKLNSTGINATDLFSIPFIPSLNVAYHREHLVFASRPLKQPSPDSGANMDFAMDPSSGIVLQILRGGYNVNRFRESLRVAFLCGSAATDYRKGVFLLSA